MAHITSFLLLLLIWTAWMSEPVHGKECGGVVTGMYGDISSPNYPHEYANNLHCTWTIEVPRGYAMKLTYHFPFDVAEGDYLKILEPNPFSRDILFWTAIWSGQKVPPGYTSRGARSRMEIQFSTDEDAVGKGFSIAWEKVVSGPECGGKLTGAQGSITSPKYPDNYGVYSNCTWVVTVSMESAVRFTFQEPFAIGNGQNHNYIKIYETDPIGTDLTLHERMSYGQGDVPPPYTSTGSVVEIRFVSGKGDTGKGFNITWEEVASKFNRCGGRLVGLSGAFATPNYPLDYDDNTRCTWLFDVDDFYYIRLRFKSFHLQKDADILTIYENNPSGGHVNNVSYTGNSKPPIHTTNTNRVEIVFSSDDKTTQTGVYVIWETVGATCGGDFDASVPGSISTPQYPNNYWQYTRCDWYIHAPFGKFVQLTFESPFDVQDHYDYVKIVEFDKMTNGREIVSYDGRTAPPTYTTTTYGVKIKFKSTGATPGKGFKVSYKTVETRCGGILNSLSGSITSPNYPDPYNNNDDCTWVINPKPNAYIQLIFHPPFQLESDQDNVTISELSPDGAREEIGSYSGHTIPVVNTSTTNTIEVRFMSNGNIVRKGFRMTWESVGDTCGGTMDGLNGSMTSPQYPRDYYDWFAMCTWIVVAPAGHFIRLTFNPPFGLGNGWRREPRLLKVYDLSQSGVTRQRRSYSGVSLPLDYTSSTNRVVVVFKADTVNTQQGFNITWERVDTPGDPNSTQRPDTPGDPNSTQRPGSNKNSDDDGDNKRYLYSLFAIPCVAMVIAGVYFYNKRSKAKCSTFDSGTVQHYTDTSQASISM